MNKTSNGGVNARCRRALGALGILIAGAFLGTPAAAVDNTVYSFGDLLAGDGAPLDMGFATVTVSRGPSGASFLIEANGLDGFASSLSTGAFIDAVEIHGAWTGELDGEGGDTYATFRRRSYLWGNDGFTFDLSHGAASRLEQGEDFGFYWYSNDLGSVPSFDSFALRVRGLDPAVYGTTAAIYGASVSSVPEPATAAMLVAGLAVVSGVRRRRGRTR